METILTSDIKENFYIRLYFNTTNGFENAGLKRAYLDFNRTLKIKNKNSVDRKEVQTKTQEFLKSKLLHLIRKKINTQDEFDFEHKKLCFELINFWDELKIGQAQKWINMTLKYWLLFGNDKINYIEENSTFFHIPIDSYVQKGMFDEKTPKPWSKIDDYDIYFNYQKRHRELKTGNPPIIDEFLFFNNYIK